MVFTPPNTFELGSPTNEVGRSSDEGPQTSVTITHGFWMGKYEVTQKEYLAVVGANPSGFPGDLNRPVVPGLAGCGVTKTFHAHGESSFRRCIFGPLGESRRLKSDPHLSR